MKRWIRRGNYVVILMTKIVIIFLMICFLICACQIPGVISDFKIDTIKFNSSKGWNKSIQIEQDDISLKIKGQIFKRQYKSRIMLNFKFKPKKSKLINLRKENILFENDNFILESLELSNKKDNVYYCGVLLNKKIDLSKPYIFKFWLNNIFKENYLIEAKFD